MPNGLLVNRSKVKVDMIVIQVTGFVPKDVYTLGCFMKKKKEDARLNPSFTNVAP